MAGGVWNIANNNYYLYNGQDFWTLSPSVFYSNYSLADVFLVQFSGSLYDQRVVVSYRIRPVINLKADIKITKGDGTALNPFVVKG